MKLFSPFLLLLALAGGLFAQKTPAEIAPKTGQASQVAEKNDPSDPALLSDPLPPQVACLNEVIVSVLAAGPTVIHADDLLSYAQDNATPIPHLLLGVRRAGTGSGFPTDGQGNPLETLALDCSDVGNALTAELWVMDGSGNAAYCTTTVYILDYWGHCNSEPDLKVCFKTLCSGKLIEEVTVNLSNPAFVPTFGLTAANGCADFNNIPTALSFSIAAAKDGNPLQGVDAHDFERLSRHLSGELPFSEPWEYVAADVNRDGMVTAEDSVELRKLLLGIYTELPDNAAWRFVPSGYVFPWPDPLSQPIPETISIVQILTGLDTLFWGIKVGDLDCSSLNVAGPSEPRGKEAAQPSGRPLFGQMFPNPAVAGAQLPVHLPYPERVRIEFFDTKGRMTWAFEREMGAGQQWLQVPRQAMPLPGAYAWRAAAGSAVASGHLLRQ